MISSTRQALRDNFRRGRRDARPEPIATTTAAHAVRERAANRVPLQTVALLPEVLPGPALAVPTQRSRRNRPTCAMIVERLLRPRASHLPPARRRVALAPLCRPTTRRLVVLAPTSRQSVAELRTSSCASRHADPLREPGPARRHPLRDRHRSRSCPPTAFAAIAEPAILPTSRWVRAEPASAELVPTAAPTAVRAPAPHCRDRSRAAPAPEPALRESNSTPRRIRSSSASGLMRTVA